MERTTTSTTETKAVHATSRPAGSGSRGRSTVDRLVELQSLIGNRPTGLILQAKLSVSQPSDPSEKEADDVAERVLNLSDSAARSRSAPNKCGQGQTLQRKCAACEDESREEDGDKKERATLRRKSASTAASETTIAIDPRSDLTLGGGQPLPSLAREFFEPRFGRDFSNVRVHTGAEAAESAQAVNALAYTVGSDIVFGAGQYSPSTREGRRLIGHELAHVIQQGSGGEMLPGQSEHIQARYAGPPRSAGASRQAPRDPWISFCPTAPLIAREPAPDKPHADPVTLIRIGISSKRVLFKTGGGVEYTGTVDMSDLEIGNYEIVPQVSVRKWVIVGSKPGLRFDIDLGTVDPWRLPYADRVTLQVIPGELEGASLELTVDERIAKLADLIQRTWTGGSEEEAIIRIISETPESQAAELVKKLSEQTINSKSYFDELDRVVDLENNMKLHEALSALRIKAMGAEIGGPALASAPVLPWHDVMGFFEDAATFRVARTSSGKVLIEYFGGTRLFRSTDFGTEISKLPFNLLVGGQEYDPNQVLIIHDYDTGRFVPVVAQQLLGYEHSGVRKFLGNVATVASLAIPTSAARTVAGKVAVAVFERVLPVAFLVIDENRLNLVKWFPKWGPKMIRYADIAKVAVAVYGISRFAVSGWQFFRQWKQVRNSRVLLEGASTNPDAEKVALMLEKQADTLIAEAEKIHASEAVTPSVEPSSAKPADLPDVPAPLSEPAPALPPPSAKADPLKVVSDETLELFKQKPELREALEGAPLAAQILKRCKSPCYPDFVSRAQIQRLEKMLEQAETSGISVNEQRLTDFLREPKTPKDFDIALDSLAKDLSAKQGVLGEFGEAGAAIGGDRTTPALLPDTSIIRNQPGVASGGKNLPDITARWFPAVKGKAAADPRVAQIPGQIARKMQGMHFRNFEDFRETFWKFVAADSVLSKGWSNANLSRMKEGFAPFTVGSEAVGGGSNAVYQLNHKLALKNAGDVFNMDNLEVVSPAFHGKIGD